MTSSHVVASLLIGLALLNWRIAPLRPGWLRLVAGAGLFALLTAAVVHMAGSPLAPSFAEAGPATRLWQQAILSGWWLLGARLLVELAQATLRTRSFSREGRLFSDLLAALVYLAVLFTIVSAVFGLPVGGLVATSGVIAIVLGLALQNTLADVFAGIAVGIERPYAIGDQVCLDGPVEGEVVQINWRSVQIRTAGNDIATIPNSLVAKSRIVNRSVPSPRRSDAVSVPCDAAVAPEAVIELIQRAILLCPQILAVPAPAVALARLGRRSHHYDVAFSVAHSDLLGLAKSTLLQQVLRQFRAAGIKTGESAGSPETPGGERAAPRPDLLDIPLFEDLPRDTRLHLAEQLIRHLLEPGQVLFAQGDTEASLFIVTAGVLEVSRTANDLRSTVGRIGAGDYIGEIGMLTGVPHAATVTALTPCTVFELRQEQVAPLLAEKPELVRAFEASARRGQALLDRSVAASVGSETVPAGALLDRIRAFFHLPVG
jgi:small-conductance mechanosensitive channel